MKRGVAIAFFAAMALGLVVERWWLQRRAAEASGAQLPIETAKKNPVAPSHAMTPPVLPKPLTAPADGESISPEQAKARQVARIKKDYEEMMTRFAAEFSAAGKDFPGGLNAYLRQLALLEREKWKDLAAILTPRELEDLQLQDTHAGQLVRQSLANSTATDEQRRAVFRLQQEFDDKWALTFDLTPATLLARQTERQTVQENILGVLGPDLFGAWLRGEGSDYALSAQWAAQQGFAPDFALNEWRLKSEFMLGRLQIATQAPGLSRGEVQAKEVELSQRMRERAVVLLGPAVVDAAQRTGRFLWLHEGVPP